MDRQSFAAYADEIGGLLLDGENVKLALWKEEFAALQKKVLSGRFPGSKPPLDMETLTTILNLQGTSVRLNQISRELEIKGVDPKFDLEQIKEQLPIILNDQLRDMYVCTKESIADLLGVIGGINAFNPVLELLSSVEWDGKERLQEVIDILGIEDDDSLSVTLIFKWLWQTVALAMNNPQYPFGADGMLVLQGPQGIGKTSFVRHLGMRPDLCRLGQYIDPRDKDTTRRCCSAWIVELGEIESTMRGDLERLKCFITSETDLYRLPYGRTDCKYPRRSSLIGTCNTTKFLNDASGNRRFWTVPVRHIDLEHLNNLDVLQLWVEIKTQFVDRDLQGFRLTSDERAALAERNCAHEMPVRAQEEIEDIFADAEENPNAYIWKEITVAEFKMNYDTLRQYTVEQIGTALTKLGVHTGTKKENGKTKRCRRLPVRVIGPAAYR